MARRRQVPFSPTVFYRLRDISGPAVATVALFVVGLPSGQPPRAGEIAEHRHSSRSAGRNHSCNYEMNIYNYIYCNIAEIYRSG